MPTSNVFIHLTTEQNIKSEFKHYQIQLKCFDELHYNALLRFTTKSKYIHNILDCAS